MINLTIIGNVTHTPESKTTPQGVPLTTFTVAAPSRGGKDTRFFRVTAWRALGETCAKYLEKGKKVAVVGDVNARAYMSRENEPKVQLEMTADSVEFLSPRSQEPAERPQVAPEALAILTEGESLSDEDLPF